MIFAIELKKLILFRRTKSSVRAKTESNNAVNFIRATSAYLGDRKISSKVCHLKNVSGLETRLFQKVGFLEAPQVTLNHYYF